MPVRRLPSLVAALSCAAFVPVIAAPASAVQVSGQNTEPIRIQSFQYEDSAAPVNVSAPPAETVTLDKWARLAVIPVRRPASLLPVESNAIPVTPTTLTPQVYIQGSQVGPIAVQSFQYDDVASPVLVTTQAESITVDKWERRQSQPAFTIKRTAEYKAYVTDNSSLIAPERPSLDKWVVRLEQPRQDVKRQQWTYQSFFGENLHVAPTAAGTVYIAGQSTDPIRILNFQYPSTAKPVTTPAAIPETITADKWLTAWPQPYFRPKRLIQYGVNCAIAEQADDGLPPVHWIPPQVQPYPYRRQAAREGFSVTARLHVAPPPESLTLDKWAQQTQRPRFDLKRNQWIYPVSVSDQLFNTPAPVTPAVFVSATNGEPIRVLSFQYDDLAQPLIGLAERASIDKWVTPTERPRWDLKRSQWIYPSFSAERLHISPGAETVTLDKWGRNYPDLVNRARRLNDYTQSVIDPTLRDERTSLDKWSQPVQEPRRDLPRRQYIYPVSVSDYLSQLPGAEVISLDKWGKNYPDLIFRASRLRDYSHFSIDPTPTTERASVDKWVQPIQQPRLDLKRAQWLYPTLAIDSQFYLIPPIEVIRPDKWIRQTPDLIFRAKRLPDYGQFSIDPTLRAEQTSIDRWLSSTVDPRRIQQRFIQPENGVLFVPETLTLDKWNSVSAQPQARSPRLIVSSAEVLFVAETVTVDKWLQAQEQPRAQTRRLILSLDQVLFVSESITLDKWLQTQTQPTQRLARLIADSQLLLTEGQTVTLRWLTADVLPQFPQRRILVATPDVFTALPLSAWLELVQPFMPRDIARKQYFYLVSASGTDISLTLEGGIVIEIKPDYRTIIVPVDNRIIDV